MGGTLPVIMQLTRSGTAARRMAVRRWRAAERAAERVAVRRWQAAERGRINGAPGVNRVLAA